MAEIEVAIGTALKAHAGLSALVGARVYPAVLPEQQPLPAVVFHRISAVREHAFGLGDPPAASVRFQFDCWGDTYQESVLTSKQVRKAAIGMMADGYDVIIDTELDDYDPESKRHRRHVDVLFTFVEDMA